MRRLLLIPLAAVLVTSACSAGAPTPKPSINGLQTVIKDPSHDHTTRRQTYDHKPPVGGPHWPPQKLGVYGWLRCGVYNDPVPNEFAVHSEEHGAVWLTYLPGEDPSALVKLATGNDYVLASPYPGQPGRYMASTWGAQLTVDSATDPRLAAFVKTYAGGGQGGEKGADCSHGTLPADAEKALAKANP